MSKKIKKVAVIGLGALGILFANQMRKNMDFSDLVIVADEKRIEKYKNSGIYANDEKCDFNFVTPSQKQIMKADFIMIATKFTTLDRALCDIENLVGKDTIIISIINGIISEEKVVAKYGKEHVLYSIAQKMDATRQNQSVSYINMGEIRIGLMEKTQEDDLFAVIEFFERTKVPYVYDKDIIKQMWMKLMANAGINQATAMFETTYGGFTTDKIVREYAIGAMQEVRAIANKKGINITQNDLDMWVNSLDKLNPSGTTSMAQDILAKRHTEIEIFAGTIIKLGKQYDVPTPINEFFYNGILEKEKDF
ncbi:MAG: 2-dehydropantoate 2-reductase [Clostridia bacterium]